jgi:multiple sugar transport system substrate-binding protein
LLFENWLRQNGKALYTAEGQPGFGPEDLAAWFELWVELREAGACVNADTQSADTGPIETTVITQGKAATQFVTSNQLVAFQALNQDKIGIGIYPKARPDATGGHYRKPSMYFSLSGASSKPELAVEMINFFVNDPEAGKALGVERGVPAASKVRDAIRPELDENSLAAMDFVTNLGDMIGPLPPAPPPAAGEIEVQLRTKSQEVAFGVQSPIDAGNAFFDEVNAILQRSA